ncbi:SRPBCC family protein [Pseudomonas putida]
MASIHHRATLSVEPEAVWHLLNQFYATNMWHDRIAVSSMERSNQSSRKESSRTLQLAEGEVIQERLLFIDAGRMTMTYGLSDSEGAFKEYASTVSVKPVQDGHQAQLEWQASFTTNDDSVDARYESLLGEFILEGLDGVAEHLGVEGEIEL